MRILLLVGTETGNATIAAEAVDVALSARGHEVHLIVDGAQSSDLAGFRTVLVCTSSHGQGDIPDNLLPFCQALERQSPDLGGIRYGLIVLGDRSYAETFGGAGKKVDALLARLGAVSVRPRLVIDANEHPVPDAVAVAWALAWEEQLGETAPVATSRAQPSPSAG